PTTSSACRSSTSGRRLARLDAGAASRLAPLGGPITLLIALGFALYICWLMLQPFFNVLLWAMVLTVVFYPMHLRIRDRSKGPSLAAATSTLLVVLLIVLPVTSITIAVVRELSGAAANLQSGVQ